MGVYIKGMKMPKQCYDCQLCYCEEKGRIAFCRAQLESNEAVEGGLMWKHVDSSDVDKDCPLIEVADPKWIPVSWHEITEEERAENGYPKDWDVFIDCEMPSDEEEILVTTRYGRVEKDVCYEDGEFSLDSGYDWVDDIVAWQPLPEPYKESEG